MSCRVRFSLSMGGSDYRWDTDFALAEELLYSLDVGCRDEVQIGHELYRWGADLIKPAWLVTVLTCS